MTEWDMPKQGTWEKRGGWVTLRLTTDLHPLKLFQAAGIVGNLGFESDEFKAFHEEGVPVGLGGYGWAQWTGPRRRSFFVWCSTHRLQRRSDQANYGYLLEELRTTHRSTMQRLHKQATIDAAVWSVGQTFERPGGTTPDYLPGMTRRLLYAQRALTGALELDEQNKRQATL